jgi:hypothetical protein
MDFSLGEQGTSGAEQGFFNTRAGTLDKNALNMRSCLGGVFKALLSTMIAAIFAACCRRFR